MKRQAIAVVLCTMLSTLATAQIFTGKVINEKNEPLPFASLYVRELSTGFIADDQGNFRTNLVQGRYTCEVSSLGYNKRLLPINVTADGLTMNIALSEHVYQLDEVQITRKNEDPAYTVMRQVIAHAPRNRYNVSTYTAETYLKGSGKLSDVPSLLMLSKEFKQDMEKYMGRVFLLEEQRNVVYKAPSTWENEVIAYANTFPEGMIVTIETTDINLYYPRLFNHISPLSSGAFTYYDYKLEGCFSEGEHLINKVKVIPKKDDIPELTSGYLYVVEDLWCLSGLELSFSGMGVKAKARVTCSEVKPSLFATTSISLENQMSMLGFKAEASFLSSIRYIDIKMADHKNLSPLVSALASDNEDLTTRQAYRMSKLIEKNMKQTDTIPRKYKYERIPWDYHLKTDSLAGKRDSSYWEKVRSIPLSEAEMESYAYKKVLDGDSVPDEKKKGGVGSQIMQTFFVGNRWETKNKKAWLEAGNYMSIVPEYNFVDGLWLGYSLKGGLKFSEQTSLRVIPSVYYTTARKQWLGTGKLLLEYAPRRLGELQLSGGKTSADFNGLDGENRLINSYAALVFGRSYIKFYDKHFFSASNKIELANSLLLTTTLDWERRSALENQVNKSIFGKEAKPNLPGNPDYMPMDRNELLKAGIALSYTPAHYYRMIRGKKEYEESSYPTFGISYQQAFRRDNKKTPSPAYKKLELFVEHQFLFGMFNEVNWYVNGGTFWDKENMQFPDFQHFATTKLPVTERAMYKGFSLLDNYVFSTNTRWAQANVVWSSPYLLVKRLPFLRKKYFDEAFHLRSLAVYDRDLYTEVGYSIGLRSFGRAGVFVGFDKLRYRSVGVSVSLPLFGVFGR